MKQDPSSILWKDFRGPKYYEPSKVPGTLKELALKPSNQSAQSCALDILM